MLTATRISRYARGKRVDAAGLIAAPCEIQIGDRGRAAMVCPLTLLTFWTFSSARHLHRVVRVRLNGKKKPKKRVDSRGYAILSAI